MASALLNGHFHDPILLRQVVQLAGKFRDLTQARNLGQQGRLLWERGGATNPDPRRDFNDEFGWPRSPGPDLYDDLYNHDTIAAKATALPAIRCWRVSPQVYEKEDEGNITGFEKSFDAMPEMLRGEMNWYRPRPGQGGNPYFAACRRLDILGRRGRYGVMWHCVDDGLDPRQPVAGIAENHSMPVEFVKDDKKFRYIGTRPPDDDRRRLPVHNLARDPGKTKGRRLLALKPFPESMAQVTRWEGNPSSQRYLQPTEYLITEIDPNVGYSGLGLPVAQQHVHWTRCTHYADTYHHAVGGGGVLATPALQVPLRDILNAVKVAGAGPEGYYRAVIARLFFETLPQFGADAVVDEDSIADMMEELDNGMQKHGVLKGLHANQPPTMVVDPTPHLDAIYKRLAIYLNKPKRIFEGSERGELSSGQDERDSAADDAGRQNEHLSPNLVAPMINTGIALGVLEPPGPDGFTIEWPPLHDDDAATKATVFSTRSQAYAAALGGGVPDYLGDINFLTKEAGFTADEAEDILEEQEQQALEQEEEARAKAEELGAEEQPPEGFSQPPPEPTETPIKVKEGEKLVMPSKARKGNPLAQNELTWNEIAANAFDPDQPRDEDGRWAGGGGSSGERLRSAVERVSTFGRDDTDLREDRKVADRAVEELSKLPKDDVFEAMSGAGIEGVKKTDSKKAMLTRMHNRLTAAIRARERAEV